MPQVKENKLNVIRDWVSGGWWPLVIASVSIVATSFGFGMWLGSYITRTELNNSIMNMRLDHQKELIDEKNSGKEAAVQEIKEKSQQYENLYLRLKEDLKR